MYWSKLKISTFMLAALFTVISATTLYAYSELGLGRKCTSCHTLDKNEAERVLSMKDKTGMTITDIGESLIPGIWEISYSARTQKGRIYLSFDKVHFFTGGIGDVAALAAPPKVFTGPERGADIERDKLPYDNAVVIGNPAAKNRVVVFTDTECVECRKNYKEYRKTVTNRPDISFYIFLAPDGEHSEIYNRNRALKNSQAIMCEKSQSIIDKAFTKSDTLEATCSTDVVGRNTELKKKLGLGANPVTILMKGDSYSGFMGAVVIEKVVSP